MPNPNHHGFGLIEVAIAATRLVVATLGLNVTMAAALRSNLHDRQVNTMTWIIHGRHDRPALNAVTALA